MSLSISHFTPQCLLARLSAHSALTHCGALAKLLAPQRATTGSKATIPAPPSGKAAQTATASGSAAQLASLHLRKLNKRSTQFGAWTVVVRGAQVEEYECLWEGTKRTGETFSCLLVSSQGPSAYCIGQMRFIKRTESTFRSVQHNIFDGLAFTMTKVSIVSDAKKQYNHAPSTHS